MSGALSALLSGAPEGVSLSLRGRVPPVDLLLDVDKEGVRARARADGWELSYRAPSKGQPQAERTAARTKRKARGNAEATATGR